MLVFNADSLVCRLIGLLFKILQVLLNLLVLLLLEQNKFLCCNQGHHHRTLKRTNWL